MTLKISTLLAVLTTLLLTACTVGPTYRPPQPAMPEAWQEEGPWRVADPRDAVPRGAWWQVFGDAQLNRLQELAMAANPDLQIALSRVAQARAALGFNRAERLPRLDLNPSARRSRITFEEFGIGGGITSTDFSFPLDLSYEIDLWGRVRHAVDAADAGLEATAADFQSARLSLQSEVARTWFALRALDSEAMLLQRTIDLRQERLSLVRSRFEAGEAARLDLTRAETELAAARADAKEVARQRSARLHALAVLVGRPASGFTLEPSPLDLAPPAIAAGLPATLLERRPDVAAAERRMAAANARIGVAHAAFFPAVRLFGSAGFQSAELGDLFNWDNRVWALGPALTLPVFDGGRNRAELRRTEALWNEASAAYRRTVLAAIAEVEDGLSGLRYLAEQAEQIEQAVAAARQAAELSAKRYRAGMVSYLEVVDSERTLLQFQRRAARILGQRLETSAFLVKALGGGWGADEGDGDGMAAL